MLFWKKTVYSFYCIQILKSAIFIYMYKTIYLLRKTNQWTSFKPVSKPENQTQTGFLAIKTPFISLYIYIKKKRTVDLYTT
jgi:hypothetical protein